MNVVVLVRQNEDKLWTFTCPDIPGMGGRARDRASVARLAAEQIGAHVRGMASARRILPAARTLDQLRADPAFQAATRGGAEIEVVTTRM